MPASPPAQVGDILDRGDDEVKIFYYMEKLQQQAKEAGGQLHVLNGNHETMNTAGRHTYATPGPHAAGLAEQPPSPAFGQMLYDPLHNILG